MPLLAFCILLSIFALTQMIKIMSADGQEFNISLEILQSNTLNTMFEDIKDENEAIPLANITSVTFDALVKFMMSDDRKSYLIFFIK